MKNQANSSYVLFVILLTIPLSGVGVDLYAPALPAMAIAFGVSPAVIKLTISTYLIGICLGQFISGTLSDCFGRKPLQWFGSGLFIVSSLLAAGSFNMTLMLCCRFLQGFSSGSMSAAARSQVPDLFSKERIKHIASYLALAWGIGPIVAPWIGGYLQYYIGWRACFYFYALYGALLFGLVSLLKESIQQKTPLNIVLLVKNYKTVLRHPQFMGALVILGVMYVVLVLFGIAGPFIIQVTYHLSAVVYGYLALFVGAAYLSGALTGKYFHRVAEHVRLQHTMIVMIILSVIIGILSLFIHRVILYVVYVFIINFCVGLIYPVCFALSMSLFREMSGIASAVTGFGIMFIAGLVSVIAGCIHVTMVYQVILIYLVLVMVCLLLYWAVLKSHFMGELR